MSSPESIPVTGVPPAGTSIRVAPALLTAATAATADAVRDLGTTTDGLSD